MKITRQVWMCMSVSKMSKRSYAHSMLTTEQQACIWNKRKINKTTTASGNQECDVLLVSLAKFTSSWIFRHSHTQTLLMTRSDDFPNSQKEKIQQYNSEIERKLEEKK